MIAKRELIFQIVLHIIVLLFYAYDRKNPGINKAEITFFLNYIIVAGFLSYHLMPKYLYRHKYLSFIISVFLILVLMILVEEYILEPWLFPNTKISNTFGGIIPTILNFIPVITILTGGKFAWDAIQQKNRIEKLESLIEESELQYLRSQINPHFLFNNLNNLYSYALEGSPKTPDIILEMSGLLRYMLYESKEDYVPLSKEIKHLDDFVKLYKLQIEDRGRVDFHVSTNESSLMIAPLILIVFVENAFKHSQAGQANDIYIDISLNMDGNKLIFDCKNNYEINSEALNSNTKGIGLKNVKKRLQLLYPKSHTLLIDEQENTYNIRLEMNLHKAS